MGAGAIGSAIGDYINGKVAKLGAEYGITTPYNSAVVRMVKAKEVFGPA